MRKYNEYIEFDDHYEIVLYKPNSNEEITRTKISLCDKEICSKIF